MKPHDLLSYRLFGMVILLVAGLTSGTAFGATPLTTELVADGLSGPVYLTAPLSDSTRLFVVEQNTARIRVIENGALLGTPFLDISDRVTSSGNEQGLLCLAFHPNYETNGYFYVNYTDDNGDVQLSRFTVTGDPNVADPNSELLILNVGQPQTNHNGGTVAFSPIDGYLYLGLGDGGGAGDNHGLIGNGQDSTNQLGSIGRLDVDGGTPFAIPADNPFVGRDGEDEIWAYGLRNPWRMSFDRETGDLYIADVGQNQYEEVNFQPYTSEGGENYGWRLKEGLHCHNPASNCEVGVTLVDPFTEYGHGFGCSITGGYVYRGCAIPDLQGTYFYAEYCTGDIISMRYDGSTVSDSTMRSTELEPPGTPTINNVTSFGEDAAGELYVVDQDGEIFRIIPAVEVPDCTEIGCCDTAGDANNDGSVNVGDGVYIINYVFKGGTAPSCDNEGDANSDCAINVGDGVYIINFVFKGGPSPVCGCVS